MAPTVMPLWKSLTNILKTNNIPKLSSRLMLIAEAVADGKCVCDVGCDHGLLSIYLSKVKNCSVTAIDVNEKPIAFAEANIKKYNAKGIELLLNDGLIGINTTLFDYIIIAGIGGEVIAGILGNVPELKRSGVIIVLQPTTSAEVVRGFLSHNGFEIKDELAFCDNNKIYSRIIACYTGNAEWLTKEKSFTGDIDASYPAGKMYIKKQYKRLLPDKQYKNVTDYLEKLLLKG